MNISIHQIRKTTITAINIQFSIRTTCVGTYFMIFLICMMFRKKTYRFGLLKSYNFRHFSQCHLNARKRENIRNCLSLVHIWLYLNKVKNFAYFTVKLKYTQYLQHFCFGIIIIAGLKYSNFFNILGIAKIFPVCICQQQTACLFYRVG